MNDRPAEASDASAGASVREADAVAQELASLRQRLAALEATAEALRASLHAAHSREQVLGHELQHRVRNMLAVIQSILRRTRESGASQDEFAEHFQGRLEAIARYQPYLGLKHSAGVEIEDIVRNELFDVGCSDGPMCTIAGPPVQLSHDAAELMGLVAHELTTNSIKFGALAHEGKIRIEWSVDGVPPEARMNLHWTETGVPVVATAPRAKGFGRQLIEEALPYQLGAVTSFELKPGGLDCLIVLPLSNSLAVPDIAGDLAVDALHILSSELEA